MPVYERGAGFQAVINDKSLPGGRMRVTFPTRIEAEAWELSARGALMQGRSPAALIAMAEGLPATLEELLDRVRADHWSGMRAEKSSVGNARLVIDMIGPKTSPADVSDKVVSDLVTRMKGQDNTPATINRKLAALSKMLTWYIDKGGQLKMPRIPRLKEALHRVRYITEDEERRMLQWCSDNGADLFADFIAFGMDTGLRTRGEHLALERSNILMRDGSPYAVMVHPDQSKTGKPRTVPLTKRAQEIVTRRADRLFRDLGYASLLGMWSRMALAMGLQDDEQFIPYILRHTFCSRLVQRGVHLVTVRELAGHSDIKMTMRYSHLSPHNYTDAISKLESA